VQAIKKSVHQFRIENGRASSEGRNRQAGLQAEQMRYRVMGDGCLMEGISEEAISMAGHYKLGRLIAFWDNNSITIDGATSLAVSDNEVERFRASGWHIQEIDGHDTDAIRDAIAAARALTDKPSMIACKTIIGVRRRGAITSVTFVLPWTGVSHRRLDEVY
jgi:transketolase